MRGNRVIYAIIGVIMMLLAGLVYAWSIISRSIAAFFVEWSVSTLSLTFTICMMSFCIGCMLGGIIARKFSVGFNIRVAGILFLIGFALAGRADSPLALYIGYGAMGGLAAGIIYNAVMSTMSAWYPDRQGLISGIMLMGFGLSSFIVGKVYQAVTPIGEGVEAWRTSLLVFGIILCIVFITCSLLFRKPSIKDDRGKSSEILDNDSQRELKEITQIKSVDIPTKDMLKLSSFWIFFVWTICIGMPGMALMSQSSGIASEVGSAVTLSNIATVVGLISISNAIGRVLYGGLFDKKGRQFTLILVSIAYAVSASILCIAIAISSFPMVVVGFICCGLSFGGLNPCISAYINSTYGKKYYSINFSIVNMNLLIASFGGAFGGWLYDMSGSYMNTVIFMICGGVLAFVSTLILGKVLSRISKKSACD